MLLLESGWEFGQDTGTVSTPILAMCAKGSLVTTECHDRVMVLFNMRFSVSVLEHWGYSIAPPTGLPTPLTTPTVLWSKDGLGRGLLSFQISQDCFMLSMVLPKMIHKKHLFTATSHIYNVIYLKKNGLPSPQSSCGLESASMINAVSMTGERKRNGVRRALWRSQQWSHPCLDEKLCE